MHTSTWPREAAHAVCWGRVPQRKLRSGRSEGNLESFVTGCELDDVLAQAGGNTSRRTGLQRARSSHRCFGTCAPYGARAREVHGLPCRMSDVASPGRPLVSLSMATPLLRRAAAKTGIAQRRSARRVACGGSGPPSRWPHGRRVCVEEEVCVESSSLRKNFESVSQTSVNGTEIDATRTLRVAL